jgi:hypothetical protein
MQYVTSQLGLIPKFWSKVEDTIVYLKARSADKVVDEMTLEDVWSGRSHGTLWNFLKEENPLVVNGFSR